MRKVRGRRPSPGEFPLCPEMKALPRLERTQQKEPKQRAIRMVRLHHPEPDMDRGVLRGDAALPPAGQRLLNVFFSGNYIRPNHGHKDMEKQAH